MVARHVAKDSWSRCETPSMLYDARKPYPPLASKPVTASSVKNPDTMESTRERLTKEMIDKFNNKGLELPHESYVAVVQVGKYVFLAVMLPVYLCCYGIPRWFAINALAPLFEGVKNQFLNIGRHIVEISKRVTDLMKGLLDQLVGDALRMAKERGKNLWRHVSRRFNPVSKKIAGFSSAIKTRFGRIKGSIEYASKKVMERAHHQSKSTNKWIAQKSVRVGNIVGNKALNYFQRFDRAFLTPFMKIMTVPFHLMMKLVHFLKRLVVRAYNIILHRLKWIFGPIVSIAARIVNFLSGQIKGYFQRIADFFLKKKDRISVFFKAAKNLLLKPIIKFLGQYKIFRPFFRIAKKGLLLSFSACKATIKYMGKLLPKKVETKNGKRRFQFLVTSLFKTGVKRFFNPITKSVTKIIATIATTCEFVSRMFRHLFRLIKTVTRMIMYCVVVVIRVLSTITKRVAFVGHVVFAVLWLSCTHGFKLAKQISDPLKGTAIGM